MHHQTLLQDLAIVICIAALATILFRWLKQPVVLGYILAGVIIGPHTPPFGLVADENSIKTLAELGIIFLMFALGLEFSLRKLQKVGATAFIAASFEIILMVLAGFLLGRAFGWSEMNSVFLGAILSISSTTIIIKALEGLGKTKEHFASLIFGILIVEDILAIVMLTLLTGFAITKQFVAVDVGMTVLGLGAFLGILLVAGLIAVPRLLTYVAKFKSDEMLLVTVVGLCLGVSLITAKLGYSVALGAFLIGAIIAEARQIVKIEMLMHPIRDLFSAVFFVSIGLLIDPKLILQYAFPILAITVVVVVGKVIACSIGSFVAGNDTRTSLRVGMGLAQIGEFSFIIATVGLETGATSDFIYPIAVAVSALTTLMTPYLIRSSDGLVEWFDHVAPKPMLAGLEAYGQWVGGLRQEGTSGMQRRILTKLGWQIGINVLLVTGIFITAAFLYQRAALSFPQFPGGQDGIKVGLWLAAVLLSFPSLVAIWRKMEAGAMMISEMTVKTAVVGERAPALRFFVSNVLIVVGTGLLLFSILLLSLTLLPSWNALLVALLIVVIAGFFLYRGSVRLYARAQSALHETFSQEADPHPYHVESAPLPNLLREAKLESFEVVAGTIAAGKMISELKLRTQTGASIVGIERESGSIINPGPDEEIETGDRMLLLGSAGQLESARSFLTSVEQT